MRIGPISPVARTWVPPQALRSRSRMVTMRSVPSRADALRSPLALAGLLEAHLHRAVLRHQPVGAGLGLDQAGVIDRGRVQIQGRALASEVDADRGVAEELVEDGREQVLPGVLLHVVEPAVPVHRAAAPARPSRGSARRCATRSPSSTTSTTATPPSVPVSNGWPPEVG